jgi:hypothetical protein
VRQKLGPKKTQRLREVTGLPIARVMVRGGTDHAKTLILEDGRYYDMSKDGAITFMPGWGNWLTEERRVVPIDAADAGPRPPGDA